MYRYAAITLIAALVGFVAGVAWTGTSEQMKEPKVQSLMRQSLAEEFTPDREILMDIVELPPHTTLERHWHPGEEFHYYLEGEAEITIDGGKTIHATPGTGGHVPYQRLHTASTRETSAKVLVFRVHRTGEPMRYLESDAKPGKPEQGR